MRDVALTSLGYVIVGAALLGCTVGACALLAGVLIASMDAFLGRRRPRREDQQRRYPDPVLAERLADERLQRQAEQSQAAHREARDQLRRAVRRLRRRWLQRRHERAVLRLVAKAGREEIPRGHAGP